MTCSRIATGSHRMPHPICTVFVGSDSVSMFTAMKIARTGSEKTNSVPLLSTMRFTQIVLGIAVERTSRASRLNAFVKSETDVLNHTHGSSALMRKMM